MTSRLIGYAYLVTLPVTVVAGIVFFAIMSVTSPDSAQAAIAAMPLAAAGFIVVTAAWSIFNMQDGVLTGLRQALIVPVENSTFSVAKIVLLVGLSGLAAYGIFLSWAIPTVIGVFLISLIVFRWLIPIHVRNSREVARPLELSRIVRFVTGDYLGALCVLAYVSLLPVIVIDRAGPEAGAYFYIVWIIYTSLNLLPLSITISHTVETVSTKGDPIARTRGALVHAMRLMIPIVRRGDHRGALDPGDLRAGLRRQRDRPAAPAGPVGDPVLGQPDLLQPGPDPGPGDAASSWSRRSWP